MRKFTFLTIVYVLVSMFTRLARVWERLHFALRSIHMATSKSDSSDRIYKKVLLIRRTLIFIRSLIGTNLFREHAPFVEHIFTISGGFCYGILSFSASFLRLSLWLNVRFVQCELWLCTFFSVNSPCCIVERDNNILPHLNKCQTYLCAAGKSLELSSDDFLRFHDFRSFYVPISIY